MGESVFHACFFPCGFPVLRSAVVVRTAIRLSARAGTRACALQFCDGRAQARVLYVIPETPSEFGVWSSRSAVFACGEVVTSKL